MLEIVFFTAVISYFLRSLVFIIGSSMERIKTLPFSSNNSVFFVSVVVPARNEEHNIARCLKSIADSNFPTENYEIIVVNDRSTDDTSKIIEDLKKEITNLVCVHITNETANPNLKGKPGAIQAGIENAKGDIVLMTDADCIVADNWIETITNAFSDSNLSFLASFTSIRGKSLFDNLQAVEWIMAHTMASAGLAFKQPLGCYGNNIAIRKKVFFELGGYNKIKFSVTEDLALIQALVRNQKFVRYHPNSDSLVITNPCLSFSEFKHQHHRWATGGLELKWRAFLFVMTTAFFWLSIGTSIAFLSLFHLISLVSVKIILDFLLVLPQFIKLKEQRLIIWSIPSIVLLMFWELALPFLLLNKNVVWKGQVFSKK